jgi:predicted PurR-regulated permease PerM
VPLSRMRSVGIGWGVLLGLLALFITLGLLRFLVFLLFMHLIVDLLVYDVGSRVRFLSQKAALTVVYALLAGTIVVLGVVVAPRFLSELPEFGRTVERNLGGKITETLSSWNVSFDPGDLKPKLFEWARTHAGESFDLAKRVGTNVVLLVVALVITLLVAHDRITSPSAGGRRLDPRNLWEFLSEFLREKIGAFYGFFRQVMAGQVVISLINAGLTFGMLFLLGIPHKVALTVMVFVFGLLPVVGNLVSNTLVCVSAFLWTGPVQVVAALVFLVVIHKLEYFLNGKIIGHIVKLPMSITLMGLIVGEALFRISGMILAIPVILFVRAELTGVSVEGDGRGAKQTQAKAGRLPPPRG